MVCAHFHAYNVSRIHCKHVALPCQTVWCRPERLLQLEAVAVMRPCLCTPGEDSPGAGGSTLFDVDAELASLEVRQKELQKERRRHVSLPCF